MMLKKFIVGLCAVTIGCSVASHSKEHVTATPDMWKPRCSALWEFKDGQSNPKPISVVCENEKDAPWIDARTGKRSGVVTTTYGK